MPFGRANQLIQSLHIVANSFRKLVACFGSSSGHATAQRRLRVSSLSVVFIASNCASESGSIPRITLPINCICRRRASCFLEYLCRIQAPRACISEIEFSEIASQTRLQFLAERLKQHFAFFCTFRRYLQAVIVDQLIILKGAFVIHVAKFNSQQEKNRLEELTTRILEQSKHVGADACEVAASASVGLDVQARLGQPEKLEMTRDQSLSITVFLGESRGSASTTDLSDGALQRRLSCSCNCKGNSPDPAAVLASRDQIIQTVPNLELDVRGRSTRRRHSI